MSPEKFRPIIETRHSEPSAWGDYWWVSIPLGILSILIAAERFAPGILDNLLKTTK